MESSQEKNHARMEEKDDLLIRRNKKVKAGDIHQVQPLVDVEMTMKDSIPLGASFKEKLMA